MADANSIEKSAERFPLCNCKRDAPSVFAARSEHNVATQYKLNT